MENKNNLLDLRMKLLEKALLEWSESLQNMSPEEIFIRMEELKETVN